MVNLVSDVFEEEVVVYVKLGFWEEDFLNLEIQKWLESWDSLIVWAPHDAGEQALLLWYSLIRWIFCLI